MLRSRTLELGRRTLVMGIVNVTPDSFSDGGLSLKPEDALRRSLQLLEEGADLLDLGGESTRPGSKRDLPVDGEASRLLPALKLLRRERPEAIVSVDTYRAEVARQALEEGAEIVNDVSGGTWDAQMIPLLATSMCGAILAHTRGRPDEWSGLPPEDNIVPIVARELSTAAERAIAAGIARERLVLDPGFGFGKRLEENYRLLAHFDFFQTLEYPLLAGTSRKGFLGRTLAAHGVEREPAGRLYGTLASVTASVLKGAHIVRVHDVGAACDAVRVADQVLAAE